MDFVFDYLKNPKWRRQHRWRKAIWTTMSRIGLTGIHALPVSRQWVDIHRRSMPIKDLPPQYAGLRIVQISDLHYSPVVWARYLLQFIRWINDLKPDVVVVTGDLITGGYTFAHRIATILSHLQATYGVICTFGNHDYSIYGKRANGEGTRRADYLEKCLSQRGLIVLRNQVWTLPTSKTANVNTESPNPNTPQLRIVGLDDEWSGNINPEKAFTGVSADDPIICLNHNPANVLELMDYPWQWMLAGHTHGRQLATTRIGKTFYPHRHRHYTHGYYAVQGRHLYVNRGLAYGQRVLDWCRPEITVFKLRPATAADAVAQENL